MTGASVFAVILAGGSGQRFWPLSRELSPKQMLSVFGQESLIAQAVHRVDGVVDCESVYIVTGERLFDEMRNHLRAQPDPCLHQVRFLQEPMPKNTAPAIAFAAATLELRDPEAVMIVLPSDHLLQCGQMWSDALSSGVKLAESGYLVTIGIKPTRPETGYGYIQGGEELSEFAVGDAEPLRAARFVEKPDAETAARFIESGEYSWNAGVFVMGARRVLEELQSHEDTAEIARTSRWLAASLEEGTHDADEARRRFGNLPSISIDYAVMERSERVATIPASLQWSDVGSLLALADVAQPDEAGNIRVGRGVDVDTRDSIVFSTDRLVATLGIENLLVIDTADATLVVPKDRAQDVRQVVELLKAQDAEEVVNPKVSLRPWGSWTSLLKGPGFQIKLLEIKPGTRPSTQRHRHRSEHWIVVAGTALVTRDDEILEVHVNESAYIPVGSVHRIENQGKVPLKVIEVQVGEYLGEDDIVRIEDDWERKS
ncbi:MAG: mannose-1-phosphate guanylyltransferase/mannose-6-phosphate isomerase [Coriobacteriales bacterium]|nr:mannose-1-phosphate guanylyltransferase/mannose-6-phosphate isomerase [Coriobacteriales bacterium]